MAQTVRYLLDQLASGALTIDQVAEDFSSRSWPTQPMTTASEFWGVTDDIPPGDNEWGVVDQDSRLSSDQYGQLAQAYSRAVTRE